MLSGDKFLRHLDVNHVPDWGPPTQAEQALMHVRDKIAAKTVEAQRKGVQIVTTMLGTDPSASEVGRKEYKQRDPVARSIEHGLDATVGDGTTRVGTPTLREDF